jgi:histidinol-phosphate/aromatic aminotransferase/cobyric acid decarboxylase-like protein
MSLGPTLPPNTDTKNATSHSEGGIKLEDHQFHGGQDWMSTENLVEDFAVTTGILGPCEEAVSFLDGNLHKIHHYPSLQQEPCRSELRDWLGLEHDYIVLGNGSSELIDLIIRLAPKGKFAVGPVDCQYKEYENSCRRYDREQTDNLSEAQLHVIVNPTNPTGDYLSLSEMQHYLENNCKDGSYVIIDESMLPWYGESWRDVSVFAQQDWITRMLNTRDIHIVVIHSWTKIFCCTGLRIGSITLPCLDDFKLVKNFMVPWNVNMLAMDYLSICLKSKYYLRETWDITSKLRAQQVNKLQHEFPDWEIKGKSFLSWMWVDTKSEQVAKQAVDCAKSWGCPIRWGKMGYHRPTHIRIAVRRDEQFQVLLSAFKQDLKGVTN